MTQDEQFMKEAIRLSRQAVEHGNEPFGAVLVKDGQIVFSRSGPLDRRRRRCIAGGGTGGPHRLLWKIKRIPGETPGMRCYHSGAPSARRRVAWAWSSGNVEISL